MAVKNLEYVKTNKSHKTWLLYTDAWKKFQAIVGHDTLADRVDKTVCEKFKVVMLEKGYAPASINMWTRQLKAAYNHLKEFSYVGTNPFVGIKQLPIDNSAPKYLTVEEIDRLLNAISDRRYKSIIEFFLYTGGRLKEVCFLTWKNVDMKNETITFVYGTKRGKSRVIPLTPRIKKVLDCVKDLGLARTPNARVFGYKSENHVTNKTKRIFRQLGFNESISLHNLRHSLPVTY